MHPFGLPIGCRVVGFRPLPRDAGLLAEQVHVHVFPSTVGAQHLNFAIETAFKMPHKVHELLGCFVLGLR